MNEKNSLWRGVIVSIHNLLNKPASYMARKSLNRVWCNISKVVRAIKTLHIDWTNIFFLIPGKTHFSTKFPNLYALETFKCCSLGVRLSTNGFSWMWRFEPTGSDALNELLLLYTDIGSLNFDVKSTFGFSFLLNPNGEFTVNRMRKFLESKLNLYKGMTIWWTKTIRLKVLCFVWCATLNGILMVENLASRGIFTL
uniref:Reverse transcriptase zinc-binding domain-containing protein n=1 Tax=Lactuca sativa TaxID=4236 RepID=A0A9R1XWF5_LACSA|nr:hypothetical protein LSAT_V11C200089580 [Lactuca sativa]